MLDNNSLYDIKKQSEQQTQTIHEKYQLISKLIQLLPQPCMILDKNSKIFSANSLVQDFFYKINSTENIDLFKESLDKANFSLFYDWVNTFFNDTNPVRTIRLDICKKDTPKYVELAGRSLLIEDTLFLIVLITDLSDILDKSAKKADNSDSLKEELILERNKSEFYVNISHDIRTPLNVILGTVQLTELSILNPNTFANGYDIMKRRLNVIKHNCYRVLKLVNNLIDISRLDAGYKSVELFNCNIVSLISEIASSITEYAENKGITLNFKSDEDELIIACDTDKVERIMFNLLSNAIRFSNENGIIDVSVNYDKKWVTISVKDNGIGIPKDKLRSIFKRFKQVNEDLSSKSGGSGIGLSLVKSLVDLLKGSITVLSLPGEGSTFTVKLPNKKLPSKGINENDNKEDYLSLKPDLERIKIEFSDI